MSPQYFLPPNVVTSPPPSRWKELGIQSPKMASLFAEYLKGTEQDQGTDGNGNPVGGITIGGTFYRGGYWHEVTAAQVTAITAAGYGARVYVRDNAGLLPGEIDNL